MIIAIRKETNASIYIDKYIYKNEKFKSVDLTQYPYNYQMINISDEFSDCTSSDFDEDLSFNLIKYRDRKLKETQYKYEGLIVAEVRKKYTLDQELAILRQRDTKPNEFLIYNSYVEECKTKAKTLLGGF